MLSDGLRAAVTASVAENTGAAYNSDWARFFSAWCVARWFVELPAGGEVVAGYLVDAAALTDPDGAPLFRVSSLTRWSASINARHTAAGYEAPGKSEVVRRTLAGLRATRAENADRAAPLRLEQLAAIVRSVHRPAEVMDGLTDRLAAARNAALVVMALFGAFRESELVALQLRDAALDTDGLILTVRRSKGDQQAVGQVKALPRRTDPLTCGPCAYVRWLAILHATDAGGRPGTIRQLRTPAPVDLHVCDVPPTRSTSPRPLLRTFDRQGWLTDRPLHRTRVGQILHTEARRAGLDEQLVAGLSGHSFRAGFVTEALAAGARPDQVALQTGHSSLRMVEIYRRDRPVIDNAVTLLPD